MNYYERHLGDYAKDTAHLTMLEHGAYNLLLDRYYATESGIPADQAHRLARARTREEKDAVDNILAEFFELVDGVWRNHRAEEEIMAYMGKQDSKDEKRNNEKERQRRHREERKHLFDDLRKYNVVMPFDTPTSQLRTALSRVTSSVTTDVYTQPVTADATANQTPDTRHQTPEVVDTHIENSTIVTRAGAVCVSLKAEGMGDVNPSHPKLLALLEEGAEIQEFVDACRTAKIKGKGFAYTLAIVDGRRSDMRRAARDARQKPGNGHASQGKFDPVAFIEAESQEFLRSTSNERCIDDETTRA